MPDDYAATTRAIRVTVRSFYLADQSRPEEGHFVWAYRVRIENQGADTVQLVARSWVITDGMGRVQRVHGEGVIGQQPLMDPGDVFEYTSGTPLETASGFMGGFYHMMLPATGERFDIEIPPFSLDSPFLNARIH